MSLPITAWVSIAHRVSGAFLIAGTALLLWLLDCSLSSPEGFRAAGEMLDGTLARLLLWAVLSALAYHALAGVKHLIMDAGIGETMEGGTRGARIVIGATVVAVVLIGALIW